MAATCQTACLPSTTFIKHGFGFGFGFGFGRHIGRVRPGVTPTSKYHALDLTGFHPLKTFHVCW